MESEYSQNKVGATDDIFQIKESLRTRPSWKDIDNINTNTVSSLPSWVVVARQLAYNRWINSEIADNSVLYLESVLNGSLNLDDFIVSRDLSQVRKLTFADYERVELRDYMYNQDRSRLHLMDSNNVNLGWKLHLNVLPRNVVRVSDYLKSKGYVHKYLHGGSPENGKVFTVYIGDARAAMNYAQEIASDLSGFLAPPINQQIEFAPNVVARFNAANDTLFTQYGSFYATSFPQFRDSEISFFARNLPREEIRGRANVSFLELQRRYGPYFTG